VVATFPLDTDAPPAVAAEDTISVVVVDDAPMDRRLAGRLLEKQPGLSVSYASDGLEALDLLTRAEYSAVVTDMQMPGMDGLTLVEEIRARFPRVPVILMTGHGSEDIAIQALQRGAASYVTKRALAKDLLPTLRQVLAAAKVDRRQQRLLDSVTYVEFRFCLENDPSIIPLLVAHLQEHLTRMDLCDETQRIRTGVALEEALLNGLYHGNLELSSDLRQDGGDAFERLGRERRFLPPYDQRRLHLHVRLTTTEATFVIRDEGPGFNPKALPDPTDPANLERIGGRGLLLIRTFMDAVSHNATGNEITMVKMGRGGR
jgi:CheY-like chemotaxis protein